MLNENHPKKPVTSPLTLQVVDTEAQVSPVILEWNTLFIHDALASFDNPSSCITNTLCSVEFALEKFKEMILGVDYNSAHRNKEPG